jgi:hypothetical protein
LYEGHKLDPWSLDEVPRPRSYKSRLNLHGTILEGRSIGLNQKKQRANKELSRVEESRCRLGYKAGFNSRIQFASNQSKLVLRNLGPGPI